MSNNLQTNSRTAEAPPGSLQRLVRRLSRVEIENTIIEASKDEPFTMPFFLASVLVDELRRQKLTTVKYTGDDFVVTVKIKKAKPPNGADELPPPNGECARKAV